MVTVPGLLFSARRATCQAARRSRADVADRSIRSVMPALHSQPSSLLADTAYGLTGGLVVVKATRGQGRPSFPGCPGNPSINGPLIEFRSCAVVALRHASTRGYRRARRATASPARDCESEGSDERDVA